EPAASQHRGRLCQAATDAARAGLAEVRDPDHSKDSGAAGAAESAAAGHDRRGETARARLPAPHLLLRMAEAFRKHQRSEKAVRRVAGQGQEELVPTNAGACS